MALLYGRQHLPKSETSGRAQSECDPEPCEEAGREKGERREEEREGWTEGERTKLGVCGLEGKSWSS